MVLPPARPATQDAPPEGASDEVDLPPAWRPDSPSDAASEPDEAPTIPSRGTEAGAGAPKSDRSKPKGRDGLTPEQERELSELQVRDRQVRAHEAAHQAAGGGLTGGASFTYQVGPDGQSYAIGGEVPVDLSSGRTPEETIARAQRVRAAAMAPADPSPADYSVAAAASQLEAAARRQASLQRAADMAASLNHQTPAPSDADGSTRAPATDAPLKRGSVDPTYDANMVYATLETACLASPTRLASQAARARVAYGV
jgi:hypothetical protein